MLVHLWLRKMKFDSRESQVGDFWLRNEAFLCVLQFQAQPVHFEEDLVSQ